MWYVSLIFGIVCAIAHASQDVLETFPNPADSSTTVFNNVAVDQNTDRIYIGAINKIYQLSSDFKVGQWIVTGPVNDAVLCNFNCSIDIIKKPTDNVNKVLLIDNNAGRLITCGSVFQGLCSVRDLYNISHDVREVQEAVVANDAISSTEAFIAPGPPNSPMTKVMYVGVTYTGNSPHRLKVPAVSSRSLQNERLFTVASTTAATEMFLNPLSRENYPINYVYGFSSNGFSYFLTTQLSEGLNVFTYHSKLVRVCHNDENYYSYTEIPLTCGIAGRIGIFEYNLAQAAFVGKVGSNLANDLGVTTQDEVLFVAFSQSESLTSNKPSNVSALCVYPLSMIRQKFLQNIKTCFAGNGTRGLDFITYSTACISTNESLIREDFCGLNVNTPLGGNIPVETLPVARLSTKLTAVAASAIDNYTVIFAGTAAGHLKKIVVENAFRSSEYKDIIIEEGSEVNKDLLFDSKFEHLYVLTERKVSKVKVHDCSKHKSCLACLGAKDPYCGWCSYDNKCSLRSACRNTLDNTHWSSYRSNRCLIISQLVPHQVQRTTMKTLELLVDNLPFLGSKIMCEFKFSNSITIFTNVTKRLSSLVYCDTPRDSLLPTISEGQHNLSSKLSLRIMSTVSEPIDFMFYDCSTYSSCTECVNSSFPCHWCLDGNRCMHYSKDCGIDILVTGVNEYFPSYRKGPKFCPNIKSPNNSTNEILVSFGEKKAITVNAEIIGILTVLQRFVCQFTIEGRVYNVSARLLGDAIYCDDFQFTYTSNAPSLTASFNVLWAWSKTFENLDGIYITIYRCKSMADVCTKCLTLPEKFGCGWCQGSNTCEVQKSCDAPNVFLNRNETC